MVIWLDDQEVRNPKRDEEFTAKEAIRYLTVLLLAIDDACKKLIKSQKDPEDLSFLLGLEIRVKYLRLTYIHMERAGCLYVPRKLGLGYYYEQLTLNITLEDLIRGDVVFPMNTFRPTLMIVENTIATYHLNAHRQSFLTRLLRPILTELGRIIVGRRR